MRITYPHSGRVVVAGVPFLESPAGNDCRAFVAALFDIPEVHEIAIATVEHRAEIRIDRRAGAESFGRKLAARLQLPLDGRSFPVAMKGDANGMVRLHRHGDAVSTWKVASDVPGRIRVRSDRLFRRKKLCEDLERELMKVVGVHRFRTSAIAGSVLVYYDARAMGSSEVLATLDEILQHAEDHPYDDRHEHAMLVCTGMLALTTVAQFTAPVLAVPAAALLIYCALPTFAGAWRRLFGERRLGVDVLDALVVIVCLLGGELFAAALLAWCLALGRRLLERAREDSRRRLVSVFSKEARSAWLMVDGVEVSVPLEQLAPGDLVSVHTGEVIPADGVVFEGEAIVDQQALTGESVPLEKPAGSSVFASTVIIGGRLLVTVQRAGKETAAARITAILNDAAAYQLVSQSHGERLADRAVLPTLALAGAGYASGGLYAAAAIMNCDFGTGIRMAAPLALLRTLSVCASRGMLVKDGRALEEMSRIDTVLLDKTGTLTREVPSVARVHAFGEIRADGVLAYAAAAERRLSHPIAAAIVAAYAGLGKPFLPADLSSYEVGYGIRVQVDRRDVQVGSGRFMRQSSIAVPGVAEAVESGAHPAGRTVVYVAVDGTLAGAIELAPVLRDGAAELIHRLRMDGIAEVAVISGDHPAPTRAMAESVGADRWFADVLPDEKARYVERLQSEGRRVCFVGDGINDAIALKRANVSVSLRGATSVATDAAQVVFMDGDLRRLHDFLVISRGLERNIAASWKIIIAPNVACIAGAFLLGFGVLASVVANNIGAVAAVANALRAGRGRISD